MLEEGHAMRCMAGCCRACECARRLLPDMASQAPKVFGPCHAQIFAQPGESLSSGATASAEPSTAASGNYLLGGSLGWEPRTCAFPTNVMSWWKLRFSLGDGQGFQPAHACASFPTLADSLWPPLSLPPGILLERWVLQHSRGAGAAAGNRPVAGMPGPASSSPSSGRSYVDDGSIYKRMVRTLM
jgi:hypothetical protein